MVASRYLNTARRQQTSLLFYKPKKKNRKKRPQEPNGGTACKMLCIMHRRVLSTIGTHIVSPNMSQSDSTGYLYVRTTQTTQPYAVRTRLQRSTLFCTFFLFFFFSFLFPFPLIFLSIYYLQSIDSLTLPCSFRCLFVAPPIQIATYHAQQKTQIARLRTNTRPTVAAICSLLFRRHLFPSILYVCLSSSFTSPGFLFLFFSFFFPR